MHSLRIRLAKETFKFSATHFTVLNSMEAERLHGHNYQVSVECELLTVSKLGMGFEFNELKPQIKQLTNLWDERVLIANGNPIITILAEEVRGVPHWVVDLQCDGLDRSYRFPKAEVVFLETVNITSEELARLFTVALASAWRAAAKSQDDLAARVKSLAVTIEETRGQSATYVLHTPLAVRT
jgi:6-pyruvoyl-tetrahydropterin synthase